jgi:hypothetical protein
MKLRDGSCKYVYQPQWRVIGHQMSSAFGAVLPLVLPGARVKLGLRHRGTSRPEWDLVISC